MKKQDLWNKIQFILNKLLNENPSILNKVLLVITQTLKLVLDQLLTSYLQQKTMDDFPI